MALGREILASLFAVSLEDAGLPEKATLLAPRVRPSGWPHGTEGKLVLPGEGPFTWRDLVEPADRDLANSEERTYRVVVLADDGVDEQRALGQMRWFLELAAQRERSTAVYDFGLFVARALERTYAGRGPGSASILHRIPTNRDANAAAAQLVSKVLGPPSAAEYFSEHANLLRPVGDPEPETLVRRLVIFAFQHSPDVEAQARAEGSSLDSRLAALDRQAPTWWRRLTSEAVLVRSCKGAFSLIPDVETISRTTPPIRAWWPLLTRFDHDHDHGLALLEQMP
jgi:hypothetical protein